MGAIHHAEWGLPNQDGLAEQGRLYGAERRGVIKVKYHIEQIDEADIRMRTDNMRAFVCIPTCRWKPRSQWPNSTCRSLSYIPQPCTLLPTSPLSQASLLRHQQLLSSPPFSTSSAPLFARLIVTLSVPPSFAVCDCQPLRFSPTAFFIVPLYSSLSPHTVQRYHDRSDVIMDVGWRMSAG